MWRFVSSGSSGNHPFLHSLNNNTGRQAWEWDAQAGTAEQRAEVEQLRKQYAANRHQQPHPADELLRLQCRGRRRVNPPAPQPQNGRQPTDSGTTGALRAGLAFYESLQQDDGHWPGDYGGPMFLMPGLLISLYTTGAMDSLLSPQHRQEMLRYLRNHQLPDGGFALHIEGHSSMFGTGLSYVSMRLLGAGPDDMACMAARDWMHARGGVTCIASWGKFWLAVLGVYSWDGMNPLTPEMWLLPYAAWTGIGLFHPGRFWCHCRMVYLPMSYMYGGRFTCKQTPLTAAIRDELYTQPYSSIDWNAARNLIAKEDLYYPHPMVQDVLWWALYKAERLLLGSGLRKAAMRECMQLIHYEDESTNYVCIGPVNKALNMLACWFEDRESEAFKRHLPRVLDYLWLAEDGMRMQGYNGSQLWDTAFAVQAIAHTGLADEFAACMKRAHQYIDATQVRENCPGNLRRWYRHISQGAWPFSTGDHGWPISDCSSEGLKAALLLASMDPAAVGPSIPKGRLEDCVNVILSFQNAGGGWATYENTRSYAFLELINPSETFGDIVIDYSYVELTSACMQALRAFAKAHPGHRSAEIQQACRAGRGYILSKQRPDGSWYGSWGVCFTYAAWFGCEGLAAMGDTVENSEPLRRACAFLLSKQRADGGWAESYLSSQDKVYSDIKGGASHVVDTAWALIALIMAGQHRLDRAPADRAAALLLRLQQPQGDWPQQRISGVFNGNCMITYANYRNIFPLWALGLYRSRVLGATG